MIFPKLFILSSTDLIKDEHPDDPENFVVSITAAIGPSGSEGGDNFSFEVATPSALAESAHSRWGRGILIVTSFSWPAIEHSINRLIAHAARNTWQEVAHELNKELLWEFDNYQPFGG
jgi:hypothetical protein